MKGETNVKRLHLAHLWSVLCSEDPDYGVISNLYFAITTTITMATINSTSFIIDTNAGTYILIMNILVKT